ncbi:regulator of chromosome condensation [Ctenocephalides felis]|uniref:regulator of chromosome condensation n=1 Tax=Ctenocephalides felis TaxID=7515 RepID=UPI000E6E3E16|nr:regulator of chromosome condensation [Ctenocephalides felis]XP_026463613.1 regulator of chromosome condensation [Ctenocephalides felis]XP_026463614.1 regulator of chromosome condensation [Ctenocephalides felis]XP_026463615.1 regulator of chromosome condensation [Ctenocephalides felis]
MKKPVKRKQTKDDTEQSKKRKSIQPLSQPSRPTTAGTVLVCGQGDVGQLGLGPDIMERERPFPVNTLENIVSIAAGGMHSVVLNDKGEVYTFGCNDEGALGRVTEADGPPEKSESLPAIVKLPSPAVMISAGDSHSCALLEDGLVYVWGTFRDSHGTLGLTEDSLKSSEPIMVNHPNPFVKVSSGADHLVLLDNMGCVFTCGCAEQGQLGRINSRSCDRYYARNGSSMFLLPKKVEYKLSLKMNIGQVWAGTYSSFTKPNDGSDIFVFGLNNYCQLGLPTKTMISYFPKKSNALSKNITWSKISAGPHHTLGIDSEGKCYALGRHEYGRLGVGDVKEDAKDIIEIPLLKDIKCIDVSCGLTSSFAVTENGDVYAWGMGGNGELGTGSEEDALTPVKLTGKHINGKKVLAVSGGGQHTIFLAK